MKPKRDHRLLLGDMREAIAAIRARTAEMNLEAFAGDETVWKATLYDLQVMGEAAKRLPDDLREGFPDLPWREMIATRDFLAHGYYRVEPQRLWSLIESELERIDDQVEAILGALPDNDDD